MVCPEAMYQRPIPSVRKYLRIAPRTTAHRRTIPKSVPATREETMSPAPTPVTAMTMPGPAYLNRRPRVDGACVLEAPSSVTSAICTFPHTRQQTQRIKHHCFSGRLIHPLGFGCDLRLGMRTRTVEAGETYGHQY